MNQEELKRLLDYNPITGIFHWKVSRTGSVPEWSVAGSYSQHGYLRVQIAGKLYFAHRLAWLYVHGKWPDGKLRYIDGDKTNNRLVNLREMESA